jgi:hypothetical protein
MVSAGNKSQRRSGDSIYRLPNDRAVTTTSRSILASRFSATEEVLMTHNMVTALYAIWAATVLDCSDTSATGRETIGARMSRN